MDLLTAAEMRARDRATIESGVPGTELMERAGRAVVDALECRLGRPLALRALVLCGPGNNGGDGFVAARYLHARGVHVEVLVLAPRERIQGDALHHLQQLDAAGIARGFVESPEALLERSDARHHWDLALDALLGTGARRPLEELFRLAVTRLNDLHRTGTRIVAVDLPTGVDADTGAADLAVEADLTVTFDAPKRGHALYPGRAHVGMLEVADIGLVHTAEAPVRLMTAADAAALMRPRDPRAHKGTAGRVLVAGGAPRTTGAVVLAARAANRAGAGYVQVGAPASLHGVLAAQLVEAMTLPLPETAEHALSDGAMDALLEAAARAHAVALGPGLSRDPEAATLARALWARCERPLVLDADGLNAFEGRTAEFASATAPRVVTPHLGELARLTGLAPDALEARRIDAALEWAAAWGCVVVMKGAPTVTACPDGRAAVNATGNPGMATAGMGDVLTGVIAALLAAGHDAFDAARLAVWIHGRAGDLAATEIGPIGLLASDVIERLPRGSGELLAQRPR